MPTRRRFLALFLIPLLPAIATRRPPQLGRGFVMVSGWICKASDLSTT
jgi:hypothetical protein